MGQPRPWIILLRLNWKLSKDRLLSGLQRRVYHFIFCTFTVFGNFLCNTLAISSCEISRQFLRGYQNSWASAPSALFFWTIIHQNDSSLRISVNSSCRFECASTERKPNFKLQKQCLKPPYRVHNSPHFSLTQFLTFLEPPSLEQRKLCDSSIASYKSCFCVVLC